MASPKVSFNLVNKTYIQARTRFSWENQQLIARARAGAFGGVYNPANTKSIAKGMEHNGDKYRSHVRGLTSREADSWIKVPSEFIDNSNFHDKNVMKRINVLLKANNTYQTPKK